jgi:PAS domain S-box-containing protein
MLAVVQGEYLIKINPAFTKTLGYSQADMDKTPFLTLTEDAPRAKEAISNLQKGQSLVSFKDYMRCKDNSHKWLDWNATVDSQTGIMYWCARDITDKIKMEKDQQEAVEQLYENEQKLSLIIDNIGEGVIVANKDKKILLANYMANELFGVEDDALISANFSDKFEVYMPDERTIFPSQNLPMDRALRGEITDDIDVVFWNPQAQEKKRVLLSGRPIVDQNNAVIAAVITIKDISRYKQMEEELKETETKYRRLIGFKKNDSKE